MNCGLNLAKDWPTLARQAGWSVAKLAKLANVSTRALELYFLKNLGQAPKIWLAEQRQLLALEQLRAGASIKETAITLGYKHVQHFSRDFKKHWGQCPTKVVLAAPQAAKLRILV